VPAFSTATLGLSQREAGVASAVAGTAHQVGASVGTALLNTIAASATAAYVAAHRFTPVAHALVHGYAVAAGVAAAILLAAAAAVSLLLNAAPLEQRD
jgi:hypothetical protein